MDRLRAARRRRAAGIPHTRGDGPAIADAITRAEQYSPHTWGWTDLAGALPSEMRVFPTHVGMDRPCRECGRVLVTYSPHTWGWTTGGTNRVRLFWVFPTHVGMDRVKHLLAD